jgi:hypothetical protein
MWNEMDFYTLLLGPYLVQQPDNNWETRWLSPCPVNFISWNETLSLYKETHTRIPCMFSHNRILYSKNPSPNKILKTSPSYKNEQTKQATKEHTVWHTKLKSWARHARAHPDPSTQEADAEGFRVQGQPGLHCELQTSLDPVLTSPSQNRRLKAQRQYYREEAAREKGPEIKIYLLLIWRVSSETILGKVKLECLDISGYASWYF